LRRAYAIIGGRRASKTLSEKIEPKLFRGSGFAISCIGHMAILALGLIFAGANPFDSAPVDAITVDIVSPNEVEGLGEPGAGATTPAFAPVAPASRAQQVPPSQPQATPPLDPRTARQAADASPAVASSSMPWLQPPPEPPPPAATREPSAADMFGLPLTMPDGSLGGSFDAPATDKANIANDDIAAFHHHLKSCATPPAGVTKTDDVKAVLRIFLKPDGTLAAPPQPIRIEGVSRGGGALYQSAVAALRKCQPYNMLPPDKYNEWKVFDLSFTPQNFGGG
jgi:hypothetical protein